MGPTTRILAFSGGNEAVLNNLAENDVVQVDETNAGGAMQRVPREGLATEHTLFGNTGKLRRIGQKDFSEPPRSELKFGSIEDNGRTRPAGNVTINFSTSTTVTTSSTASATLARRREPPS